jgi:hypothetical protein
MNDTILWLIGVVGGFETIPMGISAVGWSFPCFSILLAPLITIR